MADFRLLKRSRCPLSVVCQLRVKGSGVRSSISPDACSLFSGFSIRYFPNASTSILVRRKQSMASCGVKTMGSFSLNEVLSKTGTVFCGCLFQNRRGEGPKGLSVLDPAV